MTYANSHIDCRHVDKVDRRTGSNESVESVEIVDVSMVYGTLKVLHPGGDSISKACFYRTALLTNLLRAGDKGGGGTPTLMQAENFLMTNRAMQ